MRAALAPRVRFITIHHNSHRRTTTIAHATTITNHAAILNGDHATITDDHWGPNEATRRAVSDR
jgi:hypothetical protein